MNRLMIVLTIICVGCVILSGHFYKLSYENVIETRENSMECLNTWGECIDTLKACNQRLMGNTGKLE